MKLRCSGVCVRLWQSFRLFERAKRIGKHKQERKLRLVLEPTAAAALIRIIIIAMIMVSKNRSWHMSYTHTYTRAPASTGCFNSNSVQTRYSPKFTTELIYWYVPVEHSFVHSKNEAILILFFLISFFRRHLLLSSVSLINSVTPYFIYAFVLADELMMLWCSPLFYVFWYTHSRQLNFNNRFRTKCLSVTLNRHLCVIVRTRFHMHAEHRTQINKPLWI